MGEVSFCFILFCFLPVYFPHLAQQLAPAVARGGSQLGSVGQSLLWMCARMIPMGYCCHPTWPCHPMGGGPFLQWQIVTDTRPPFQAGPASEFTRQGHEGARQGWTWPEQRAGISVAFWPLFPQPHLCPAEGCHCACPCQSTSALSLCAPCLDSI